MNFLTAATSFPYTETAAKVLVPALAFNIVTDDDGLKRMKNVAITALAILGTFALEYMSRSYSTYAVAGLAIAATVFGDMQAGILAAGGYMGANALFRIHTLGTSGILGTACYIVAATFLIKVCFGSKT